MEHTIENIGKGLFSVTLPGSTRSEEATLDLEDSGVPLRKHEGFGASKPSDASGRNQGTLDPHLELP